jgi:hypothetical protein
MTRDEGRHHASSCITWNKKITYVWNISTSIPFYITLSLSRGFYFDSGFFNSVYSDHTDKSALCSKAPDEDALIRSCRWILLPLKQRKISTCLVNVARGTDWVKTTVVIHYLSPNVAPDKTWPAITKCTALQSDFSIHIVVQKHSGSPGSDQSAASDENKIFHALDAQSLFLCPVKPADDMISDIVLEPFCVDDFFAVAPVGKRQ